MSIEAMGPLLGALAVAPLIASVAGFSAPFIVLVGGVAMFMVALTIGRFSSVLPSAASIYTYISHGLGEKLGFLSAWLSYMYYFLFEPLLLFGFGLFAESAFDFVFGVSIDWYWWTCPRSSPSSFPSSASGSPCASTSRSPSSPTRHCSSSRSRSSPS